MKVTLCARDVGPCNILKLIAQALVKKGADVVTLFAGEKHNFESIYDSGLFIVGMSSSEELAKNELSVSGEACAHGVRAIYVADTFGSWNRPWFENRIATMMSRATIFVLNEEEAALAQEKFPKAKVVVTGNPCWDKFFFPKNTREMVRLTLGIDSGQKVMLCSWGKNKEVNILHGQKAIEVASQTGVGLVIIGTHPGDMTPLEEYYPVANGAPVAVRFITKTEMSGSDLLPGVDLVFESASTIGIEAVCQRIPVVDWFSDIALERLRKATGSDRWPLCEQRASLLYSGDEHIDVVKNMIGRVSYEHDYEYGIVGYWDLLDRLYPKPARKGIALEKMMAEIEKVAVISH